MKIKEILLAVAVIFLGEWLYAQTAQQLKDAAAAFPAMPRSTSDLGSFAGEAPTFASGAPFNDLEFTLFDTDYMDGENSGGDVFMPVDPSDQFPGSNKVKLIKCVLNTDLNESYGSANTDRIILGTHEIQYPFFLKGADGIDNDYAVILHFDYENGYIQLKGKAEDYRLVYHTIADGCKTEGWYLFYTATNSIDLIAFIFPCSTIEPSISGNPPNNPNPLCNSSNTLSLTDPIQFKFAQPITASVSFPKGIVQFGSPGKEIVAGFTVDNQKNSYLFGLTDGNLDGNTDAENEIFIAKIGSNGKKIWVTELAMKDGTLLKDATTDNQFIYVAGRTLGNLPGFTNAGRWDGILLKLNLSDGKIVAMNQWGNPGIDGYGCITQDDAGNLFVSAQGSPSGTATTDDVYLVAKHRKSDLSTVWRTLNVPNGTGFIASSEAWGGLTYVPNSTPGGGRLVAAGWYFTNTGANAFASVYENLSASAPTRPHSITLASEGIKADWILDNIVDRQGNIYLGGFTTGNLQGNHKGEGDAFVVKYSPQLTNPVFRQFGTNKSDLVRKLEIDADGTLYATGYTYGDLIGKNQDPSQLTGDIFIQKLDANLNLLEGIQLGTPHEERGFSYLKDNTLILGGMTEGNMGGINNGSFDGFALALDKTNLSVIQMDTSVVLSSEKDYGQTKLAVYPNPVSSTLTVSKNTSNALDYTITTALGRIMEKGTIEKPLSSIELSNLKSGVYIFIFRDNNNIITRKVVKQ